MTQDEVDAGVDAEREAKYGDQAWQAALAQLGVTA
jgi:hypothetical protein